MAREQRKLAAILFADAVGSSRLMGRDESGTVVRLLEHLNFRLAPAVALRGGRVIRLKGDGCLVEFASAVDALAAAIDFQQVMVEANRDQPDDKAIVFRIGLHVGDVIVEGDDIYGDDVNVAARLEAEAPAGGIVVSRAVRDAVQGRLKANLHALGELALKNIDRPIRAFRVEWAVEDWPGPSVASGTPGSSTSPAAALMLPDKPSVAVLPFQNIGGDPEQDCFADGMVEEIITALSRFKSLFVIARNSSFTFKGRAVDIKEVGRMLGVRYVLEGAVRKASDKVRITGQLVDAVTGVHLWADRFERDLTDVFALQDEVTVAVVSATQPKLIQTEIAMATRRRSENLTAYDLYLRARQQVHLATRESLAEATRLAHRALELDPQFGFVAALAGMCHMTNVYWGYAIDLQFERNEAVRLLGLALSIDDGDPDTLAMASLISSHVIGDCEREIEMADRVVALNPNSYVAWGCRAQVYRIAGQPEEAVRSYEQAIRMSPVDPMLHTIFAQMGLALIELRRLEEAVVAGKRAHRQNASNPLAHRCLASAFAHLGRDAEAREAAGRLLELEPGFTISAWIVRNRISKFNLLTEGLRIAGLPK